MTTGWTAKTLERSRRLIFSFSLEGFIWEVGWGSRGQWGEEECKPRLPGNLVCVSVLELAVLSAWGWNLGAQLGGGSRLQDGDQSGHPASRDWIWTRFGPKSLVQTVFQRGLEKASWEAAAE